MHLGVHRHCEIRRATVVPRDAALIGTAVTYSHAHLAQDMSCLTTKVLTDLGQSRIKFRLSPNVYLLNPHDGCFKVVFAGGLKQSNAVVEEEP